jgi:deoxycytidylate deaminase
MGRETRIIQTLYPLALQSKCIFKHAAAVTHGSKILGSGINDGSRTKWGQWIKVCMHAEMMALMDFLRKNNDYTTSKKENKFGNLSLWVISVPNDKQKNDIGLLRKSNPCQECSRILLKYGFKYVVYSDENGEMQKVKMNNYSNCHRSNAQKKHNRCF